MDELKGGQMRVMLVILMMLVTPLAGTLPATAAPGEPETVPPGVRVLTVADAGQTIQLRRGELFVLDLGAPSDWFVNPGTPPAAWRLWERPANGIWVAWRSGAFQATFDPPCRRRNPACMIATRLWSVTLDVR